MFDLCLYQLAELCSSLAECTLRALYDKKGLGCTASQLAAVWAASCSEPAAAALHCDGVEGRLRVRHVRLC
jgi:hypothetical protein